MIPTHNSIAYSATPVTTYGAIALCVLAFGYQLTLGGPQVERFLLDYALVPARYTDSAFAAKHGLDRTNLVPFLTSMFLHGGLLHIASNLWVLWVLGPALEDRLGVARYVALYVLAGFAAGLLHLVTNFSSTVPALGASGAIAGVIGAYARRFPYAWVNLLQPVGIIPVFFMLPVMVFAGLWFLTQLVSGAGTLLMPGQTGGVAWWAHVGGFLAGWFLVGRLAQPAGPAEQARDAADSLMWPWHWWSRWMGWWWRR
jgi:membrane associated rhomboid family serine protease